MPEAAATRADASPVRLLTAGYALFALAAGGRSAVQLATRAAEAPLAYALSAVAAVVYLAGLALTVLAEGRVAFRPAARLLCAVELTGVVVVGVLSLARPDLFPRATVWSWFGAGYAFVPVVLPVLGLVLLRRR